jgi:hypothetical protein
MPACAGTCKIGLKDLYNSWIKWDLKRHLNSDFLPEESNDWSCINTTPFQNLLSAGIRWSFYTTLLKYGLWLM